MMLALRGLGDTVCPDYPDLSTCYDQSQGPSPFLVGSGPLAPGQTRVSTGGASTVSLLPQLNQSTVWWIAGGLLFLAVLQGGRR